MNRPLHFDPLVNLDFDPLVNLGVMLFALVRRGLVSAREGRVSAVDYVSR